MNSDKHPFGPFLLLVAVILAGVLCGLLYQTYLVEAQGLHTVYLPVIRNSAAEAPEWWNVPAGLPTYYTPAEVVPGEPYYKLIQVNWLDEEAAQGRHTIDINVLDEQGERLIGETVRVWWADGEALVVTEDKPPPEYSVHFPMYNPILGCPYQLEVTGLPSDSLHCLGLGTPEEPWRTTHIVFEVTFQRMAAE